MIHRNPYEMLQYCGCFKILQQKKLINVINETRKEKIVDCENLLHKKVHLLFLILLDMFGKSHNKVFLKGHLLSLSLFAY